MRGDVRRHGSVGIAPQRRRSSIDPLLGRAQITTHTLEFIPEILDTENAGRQKQSYEGGRNSVTRLRAKLSTRLFYGNGSNFGRPSAFEQLPIRVEGWVAEWTACWSTLMLAIDWTWNSINGAWKNCKLYRSKGENWMTKKPAYLTLWSKIAPCWHMWFCRPLVSRRTMTEFLMCIWKKTPRFFKIALKRNHF